ncbi:hypothetical protein NBH00_01085 [Paraconexibacter antarcticus]|uniref:Uncharacterized protein n=1 Tax=Paraconexibacter antarcticus TaxID=2949664 RepID=A0ABY5DVE6_9ACTN|nr:hypothetical protein [Paraconexibacter antarcticus]UTI64817.1 hypothetical protein NBH00_01085 [Paraconexibacter antarcticus]
MTNASDETPPAGPAAAGTPAPAVPAPSRAEVLLDRGARGAGRGLRVAARELSERRGLRTVLVGAALTLLAIHLGSGSAFSLPLLVVGLGMIVVGAMGPRLRGHIGLDFGPEGTAITLHTHVAPPGRRLAPQGDGAQVIELPPRPRIALVPSTPRAEVTAPAAPVAAPGPDPATTPADGPGVVESSGETIEIDVEQLRAMLREAERAEAQRHVPG